MKVIMMENKVLIKLIIPEIDEKYDIFIPVNESIWKIKNDIIKAVSELSSVSFLDNNNYILINCDDSRIYRNNDIVLNTNIRNGTRLILITQSKN